MDLDIRLTPILTVDIVVMTLKEGRLHALVHQRANPEEPYKGAWALPGGYVHADEDTNLADTCKRILRDKAGLEPLFLEQFYTFADATRDPRSWSASIGHFALVPLERLAGMAKGAKLVSVDTPPKLAFDHNDILARAAAHVRNKAQFSALPCYLLPPTFTLAELQRTYEQVTGNALNASAFRRKLGELDFVEPVEGGMIKGRHRPAQVYRVKPGKLAVFDKTI